MNRNPTTEGTMPTDTPPSADHLISAGMNLSAAKATLHALEGAQRNVFSAMPASGRVHDELEDICEQAVTRAKDAVTIAEVEADEARAGQDAFDKRFRDVQAVERAAHRAFSVANIDVD